MKSVINSVVLSVFTIAALGLAACSSDDSPVVAAAPKKDEKTSGKEPKEPVVSAVDGSEGPSEVDADKTVYGFQLIDNLSNEALASAPVFHGELNAKGADVQEFSSDKDSGKLVIVRVVPFEKIGGGYRDFAFYYPVIDVTSVYGVSPNPVIYVSHQDRPAFFYNSNLEVSQLAGLSSRYKIAKDSLLKDLADYLDKGQPVVSKPGILLPEGGVMLGDEVMSESNVLDIWQGELEHGIMI